MKPADLQPGHRIPLTRPSYAPHRSDSLIVASDPDSDPDRPDLVLFDVDVEVGDPDDWIGHGELMVRSGCALVQGVDGSSTKYRVGYRPDTDVEVA